MGYKTIKAKREEFAKRIEVYQAFLAAAQQINGGLAEVKQANDKLAAARAALGKKIAALDTCGVKEFETFRKALIEACEGSAPEPLPVKPVEKAIADAKLDLDKQVDAWVDKLASTYPSEIKIGMTFKDYKLGRIYEIVSDRELVTNPNLSGDNAIFYKCIGYEGDKKYGPVSMTKAQLSPKNSIKYIKTK